MTGLLINKNGQRSPTITDYIHRISMNVSILIDDKDNKLKVKRR